MKMIFVVFSEAIECEIMAAMKKCGVGKYTQFANILGAGGHTEPRLDNNVWPGTNHAFFLAIEASVKDDFLKEIKRLREEYPKEAIKAFVMPLEEIV